jgi:hypothetical protein
MLGLIERLHPADLSFLDIELPAQVGIFPQ